VRLHLPTTKFGGMWKTPRDARGILAQVALGPAARFATFDDLLAVTMGAMDGDEGHGPLLAAGHSQDWAQCAINFSPSPLLKHYPPRLTRSGGDGCRILAAVPQGAQRATGTSRWGATFAFLRRCM
jgi:hypothetical protein